MHESDNIGLFAAAASAAAVAGATISLGLVAVVGLALLIEEVPLSQEVLGARNALVVSETSEVLNASEPTEPVEVVEPIEPVEASSALETSEVLEEQKKPQAPLAPAVESVPQISDAPKAVDVNASITACLQNPGFPSGCELAAMTSVINALGYAIPLKDFTENYVMKIEGKPEMAYSYSGSPYGRGAAWPPVMARAGNTLLRDQGSHWRFMVRNGATIDELLGVVATGRPVLVWTTMGFTMPIKTDIKIDEYLWYRNEHCVVLYGTGDKDKLLVMDPLEGLVERERSRFEEIFNACGQYAIVLTQIDATAIDAAEDQLYARVQGKQETQEAQGAQGAQEAQETQEAQEAQGAQEAQELQESKEARQTQESSQAQEGQSSSV